MPIGFFGCILCFQNFKYLILKPQASQSPCLKLLRPPKPLGTTQLTCTNNELATHVIALGAGAPVRGW